MEKYEKEFLEKFDSKESFDEEYLNEVVCEIGETISESIIDQDRWNTYFARIFKIGDRYFRIDHSRGSTEIQDCQFSAEQPYEVYPAKVDTIEYLTESEIKKLREKEYKEYEKYEKKNIVKNTYAKAIEGIINELSKAYDEAYSKHDHVTCLMAQSTIKVLRNFGSENQIEQIPNDEPKETKEPKKRGRKKSEEPRPEEAKLAELEQKEEIKEVVRELEEKGTASVGKKSETETETETETKREKDDEPEERKIDIIDDFELPFEPINEEPEKEKETAEEPISGDLSDLNLETDIDIDSDTMTNDVEPNESIRKDEETVAEENIAEEKPEIQNAETKEVVGDDDLDDLWDF